MTDFCSSSSSYYLEFKKAEPRSWNAAKRNLTTPSRIANDVEKRRYGEIVGAKNHCNQYKSTVQKTQWRSSTSSGKVWWLDYSRSQSLQWGRWISKQSSIRCRAASSRHSMDSVLSAQNKNNSWDGKECTKVSRAVRKAKSNWGFVMESPNFNTSSMRDERHCGKSSTKREREMEHPLCYYNQAWMKNGGLILWHDVAICEMSKTSWQMGKPLMKSDSGNHSKVQ